jgi:hypothetical protein
MLGIEHGILSILNKCSNTELSPPPIICGKFFKEEFSDLEISTTVKNTLNGINAR